MSGKKVLLDTNIVIGLFANEEKIIENLKRSSAVFVPSIVIGELFYGAELSRQKEANINKIEMFAESCSILACDILTAKYYGQVKSKLKTKGIQIPENDIWIASLALQHKLTVASRDKHFGFVSGLTVAKW